eukprot:9818615-Alexandrium_andersonii.AAC.1
MSEFGVAMGSATCYLWLKMPATARKASAPAPFPKPRMASPVPPVPEPVAEAAASSEAPDSKVATKEELADTAKGALSEIKRQWADTAVRARFRRSMPGRQDDKRSQ